MSKLNNSPVIKTIIALSLLAPTQWLANNQEQIFSEKVNNTNQKTEEPKENDQKNANIWSLFNPDVFSQNRGESQSQEELLLNLKEIKYTIQYIIKNHKEIFKKYNMKDKDILSRFKKLEAEIEKFFNENKKSKFSKEDIEYFKSTIEIDLIIFKSNLESEYISSSFGKIKYPNIIQEEELRRINVNKFLFIKEYLC